MNNNLSDPRLFLSTNDLSENSTLSKLLQHTPLWAWAEQAMQCDTKLEEQAYRQRMREALQGQWGAAELDCLADAVYQAPSMALRKYLWRELNAVLQSASEQSHDDGLSLQVFALPIPMVAAASEALELTGTLPEIEKIQDFFVAQQMLHGNVTFSLSNRLTTLPWLTLPKLLTWLPQPNFAEIAAQPIQPIRDLCTTVASEPKTRSTERSNRSARSVHEDCEHRATQYLGRAVGCAEVSIKPTAWPVEPMQIGRAEQVFLRFLVGLAPLTAANANKLWQEDRVATWGAAFCRLISAQLRQGVQHTSGSQQPELSLLPLPRSPMPPLVAGYTGRLLQREIALQLFVSNTLRQFRAKIGEPAAMIAAHRVPASAEKTGSTTGEIRITFASPFVPQDTEAFSWPLDPLDRVGDVEQSILTVLRDCRLSDVTILPGVYPDLNPESGNKLFIKASNFSVAEGFALHP